MHVVLCFKMRKANQNRSMSVIGILKKVYSNNWLVYLYIDLYQVWWNSFNRILPFQAFEDLFVYLIVYVNLYCMVNY